MAKQAGTQKAAFPISASEMAEAKPLAFATTPANAAGLAWLASVRLYRQRRASPGSGAGAESSPKRAAALAKLKRHNGSRLHSTDPIRYPLR